MYSHQNQTHQSSLNHFINREVIGLIIIFTQHNFAVFIIIYLHLDKHLNLTICTCTLKRKINNTLHMLHTS